MDIKGAPRPAAKSRRMWKIFFKLSQGRKARKSFFCAFSSSCVWMGKKFSFNNNFFSHFVHGSSRFLVRSPFNALSNRFPAILSDVTRIKFISILILLCVCECQPVSGKMCDAMVNCFHSKEFGNWNISKKSVDSFSHKNSCRLVWCLFCSNFKGSSDSKPRLDLPCRFFASHKRFSLFHPSWGNLRSTRAKNSIVFRISNFSYASKITQKFN